jgi:hypothetical protein
MFHDHVDQEPNERTTLPEAADIRSTCDASSISIHGLTERWKCNERKIRRWESAIGLKRIDVKGNKTIYELPSPADEARMKEMLACPFRRKIVVRKTLIPSPRIVIPAIESVASQVGKNILDRVFLTLATLLQATISCNDPEMEVQIGSRKLEVLVGKDHAQPIIKLLMDADLIHRCQGYIPGERCFAYRLDPKCFNEYEYVQLSWPARKPPKRPQSYNEANPQHSPHSPKVLNRLEADLAKLEFTADLDINAIAEKAAAAILVKIHASPKRRVKGQLDDEARANHARLCIIDAYERFSKFPRTLKPKEKSWRVYHAVACMPRILRDHLQYNGQYLCSIDIRCSQPFFLGLLFLENQAADGLDPEEIADYLEMTQSGQFYEWLMKELGIDLAHRANFKTVVFRDLLFGKRHYRTTQIFKVFARRFPSLGMNLQKLHQNASTLAQRLQRTEAKIMYAQVLPAVQAFHPDLPVITVHDAIHVPLSIANHAKDLFIQSFTHPSIPPPHLSITPPTPIPQPPSVYVPPSVQVHQPS